VAAIIIAAGQMKGGDEDAVRYRRLVVPPKTVTADVGEREVVVGTKNIAPTSEDEDLLRTNDTVMMGNVVVLVIIIGVVNDRRCRRPLLLLAVAVVETNVIDVPDAVQPHLLLTDKNLLIVE
jgi:hypothetical protein